MSWKKLVRVCLAVCLAANASVWITGCGGSSKPISLSITSSASTVDPSDTATLTASVTNDQNNAGVTWTVSGGGTLSGSTTTSTKYTAPAPSTAQASSLSVTVTATSVADTSQSATFSITVPPAPSLTTASIPPAVVGTAFSETLAVSGGISPYTWSVSSGTLPSCLTLSTAGALSGTPVASCAGSYSLTFQVKDSGTPNALTATQKLTVTINPAPAIVLPASLPAGVFGTAYTGSAAATGGSGSLTYSVLTGSLPTGLSLDPASGTITGTPSAGGTFNFSIKAADAFGDAATQSYSVAVTYPALSITTTSLPAGLYNTSYGPADLTATGGSGSASNLTWSWVAASGSSLPAGLSLSSAGAITGKPTEAGNFSVVVTAADSVAKSSVSKTFSIAVTYPTLTVTTSSLPNGVLNAVYPGATLLATGGSGSSANYTWTWAAASGSSLPAGLTLSSGGAIAGTPTAGGSFSITVTVKDSVSNTSANATLALTVTYPTLTVTTSSLPNGVLNAVYPGATLVANGGSDNAANYSWTWAAASGSPLPAGLSLSSAGVISGTPTAGGSFSITVTVKDSVSNSTANATLALTVTYPTLTITTSSLPNGILNAAYSPVTLTATGGSDNSANYTWSWAAASGSSLPPGMSLSTAGVLSGTPTSGGSYSVAITVSDSVSKTTGKATLTFTVGFTTLVISTSSLPAGFYNAAYGPVSLAATGGSGNSANYTWSWAAAPASSLPGGLSLSAAGAITGTPTATGSFSVVVTVADSVSKTSANSTLTLTVGYSALSVTTTSLPNGLLNAAYAPYALAARGGSNSNANYSWTWAAAPGSSLPAGIGLSTAGILSGTPTAGGTFSVVLTVKDSVSNTSASATLPITIAYPALSITTASLPNGLLNAVYAPVTLVATGGSGNSANYSWTWAAAPSSSLPAGLSLSTAGVLSGTPTAGGSFSVTITVADAVSKTNASATLPITITYPLLSITTNSLPNGVLNAVYSPVTLTATGGSGKPANLSWTWAAAPSSSLPTGLSLSTAGVISGTPAAGGSFSVVITVADSVSKTNASVTLPITITYPALLVTTASLPNGLLNSTYAPVTLTATGGSGNSANYSWAWAAAPSSSLPGGMSLSAAGVLSGTPTAGGAFSVVFTVHDSVSKTSAQATLTLTIAYPALSITTASLPSGTLTVAYGPVNFAASGGSGSSANWTWTWAAAPSSALPAGLNLSTAGLLNGTPTAAGSYSVVVTVSDSVSKTSANATFPITINASLAITTTSLPYGTAGAGYSQTLAATGGSGGNTWSVTVGASQLTALGLSLSNAGVLAATTPSAGTASFTAQVKDSSGDIATQPLTVAIYNTLSLTPTSLPAGTTGVSYSQTISGAGGSGNYCYTVPTAAYVATGALHGLSMPLPNSPTCPGATAPTDYGFYIGSSLPISGTPTTTVAPPYSIQFNTTLVDTVTSNATTQSYSISITAPPALSLPAPNPGSLPSATVNQAYTGSVTASGGAGSYSWTVNGNPLSSSVSLGNGTLAISSNGNSLSISGTPSTVTPNGSPLSFTASVSDSAGQSTGTDTYTIAVNNLATISGQIALSNYCGTAFTLPAITVTINTSTPQSTTTDSNGNFSFSNIPNGTYTITPSITGPESVFYPATQSVTVSGSPITGLSFGAQLGYTVSGNVTYAGASTGQTYVVLNSQNCGSGNGTSITQATLTAGGAYTIRGVSPGTYSLQAWMDTTGQGAQNTADPSGNASTNVAVSTGNITGASVTMITPTVAVPTSGPNLQNITPTDLGVGISFQSITNNNGVEAVQSYTVQWSTSSSFTSPSSATFAANGTHSNVWILNNSTAGISGSFTNNTKYYFRARGNVAAGNGPFTTWGGTTPTAVTIGAPSGSGYFTVGGSVTIPSSITPTGPLYVGVYNQNTGAIYATRIASPSNSSANTYSISAPADTNPDYFVFAILDQNNNGVIDVGDVSNTNGNGSSGIAVTGNLSGQDITLPSANSTVSVTTQYNKQTNQNGTYSSYTISFNVREGNKLPVSVTLMSGPNVIDPIDMAGNCQGCGTPQWQYYTNINSVVPVVGQAYTFLVTYSDKSTETLTGTITAVLTSSDLATNLLPDSTGVSTTPTFTWTDPAKASSYIYQFAINPATGGNYIWQIPGNNSNLNGFSSSITSITWGTDPTGGGSSPTQSTLTDGTQYNWSIEVQDGNGNQATTQVQFTTTGNAPLTLPTPDPSSLGSAVVNQLYSGAINASGGVANYTWTVNGTTVTPNGSTLVSIGDGLSVFNNGNNTLDVTGTPTTAETVSFTASITDSTSTTDTNGTVTYTINVGNSAPLTLPNPSTNSGSALVTYPYAASLQASGGSGSGYVFTLNGTVLPSNGTQVSIGNGLSAFNSGGSLFNVTGTPTTATNITFTLSVTDSASNTAGPDTYTIDVSALPTGTNNANLSGQYVCSAGGYIDSDSTLWKTLFSFQANGSGSFANGVYDSNGTDYTASISGTVTGTYEVGSDNNGIVALTSVPSSGPTVTSKWAIALTNAVEPAQEFRMVEIDDVGSSPSGRQGQADCYLATTSAFTSSTISGHNFVFLGNGETSTPAPIVTIGRFSALSGNITAGTFDQGIGAPATVTSTPVTSGSYTLPTSPSFTTTGRYTLATTSSLGTSNFVAYVIDSARMFFLQIDTGSGSFGGNVRTQQQSSYTAANLNGNMVWYFQGFEASGGSLSGYSNSVFQVSGSGTGTFTINESYQDDSGTYSVGNSNFTIPVTFDSTNPGRATFVPGTGTGYLYLYNNNAAGLLVVDGSGSMSGGFVDPQTQTTFTDAALAGTYLLGGFPPLKPKDISVGEIDLAGTGTVTGGISTGGQNAFTWDAAQSGVDYSWLSTTYGSLSVSSGGSPTNTCIVISSTKFVCIQNIKPSSGDQIFQK